MYEYSRYIRHIYFVHKEELKCIMYNDSTRRLIHKVRKNKGRIICKEAIVWKMKDQLRSAAWHT